MRRLTISICENDEGIGGYNYKTRNTDIQSVKEVIDKLGILEDIEENLGCSLDVLFKAISNGIYVKDLPSENLIKQFGIKLSSIEDEWFLSNEIMCLNVKDYKNYFWLKEDRSE